MHHSFTRRDVLIGGLVAAGMLAAGRLPHVLAAPPTADRPKDPPPPNRAKDAPSSLVAIQRCRTYEPAALRRAFDEGFKLIGGLGKLVRGKTVTVKLNLTNKIQDFAGRSAGRTYQTHPATVAALCGALADAGASDIVLVECFYYREGMEEVLGQHGWDIAAIHSAGDQRVSFETTRHRGSWNSYSRLKVPWGGYLYPAFDFNARYEKTDVLVSLAKMKEHYCAGVTLACKNIFGITPNSLYGDEAPSEDALAGRGENFHNGKAGVPAGVPAELAHSVPAAAREPWQYRIPRIVADVLGARPVDLAVVDGIETIRGGEGGWVTGTAPIDPGLLVVGRNPVCTDAVCTAVMGYDPQADHYKPPFGGENHLKLLAAAGVGTNDLKRIEVAGLPIDQARFPFRAPSKPGEEQTSRRLCKGAQYA